MYNRSDFQPLFATSSLEQSEANSYALGLVDRKGRFQIGDQVGHSCAAEKVNFRSQHFRSSNPTRASRRRSRFFQRRARIGLLDRKSFSSPPHLAPPHKTHDHNLQQLRCLLDCYYCCCCSVAHPVHPPAARTVIRWQQWVLSMTFV